METVIPPIYYLDTKITKPFFYYLGFSREIISRSQVSQQISHRRGHIHNNNSTGTIREAQRPFLGGDRLRLN